MRFFYKLFVATAILILMAHNLTPHHHHDPIAIASEEQDDDGDHDHDVFSYVQISHVFIPAYMEIKADRLFTITSLVYYMHCQFETLVPIEKPEFVEANHSPPPDQYFHSSSRRGPPAV